MKLLTTTGLTKLIQLIKANFISNTDVITTTEMDIDSTPTSASTNLVTSGGVYTAISGKQDTLVSGTNIKTINNTSILGSGDITIQSAPPLDNTTINQNSSNQLQAIGVIDGQTGNADKFVSLTKAQYDALATKDTNTFYNITDDSDVTLNLLQTIYPVGSLYLTTANTCPLSALFGTWQLQSEDIPNCVIETGTSNGVSYRIWQDGYCEQWGVVIPLGSTKQITFEKVFNNTDYVLSQAFLNNTTSEPTSTFSLNFYNKTISSIYVSGRYNNATTVGYTGGANEIFYWKASGYLASGQYTPKTTTTKTFKRIA